jgi:hypothetical protein
MNEIGETKRLAESEGFEPYAVVKYLCFLEFPSIVYQSSIFIDSIWSMPSTGISLGRGRNEHQARDFFCLRGFDSGPVPTPFLHKSAFGVDKLIWHDVCNSVI